MSRVQKKHAGRKGAHIPIYTYQCKKCGTVFDFLIVGEPDKPQCTKCGSELLEKKFSAFGVGRDSSGKKSKCSPQST